MKKLITILLVLTMLFSLCGCGGSTESSPAETPAPTAAPTPEATPEPTPAPTAEPVLSGYAATKTGQFKNRFAEGCMVAEYEIAYDTISYSCYHAIKDGMEYMELSSPGQPAMPSVAVGDKYYAIYHDTKMIVTAPRPVNPEASPFNAAFNLPEEHEVDMADFVTGTMDVNGVSCNTEEWLVNGEKSVVCFEGDELRQVINIIDGNTQIITVSSLSTEAVDDSLFKIPEGYQELKMEDLFAAVSEK